MEIIKELLDTIVDEGLKDKLENILSVHSDASDEDIIKIVKSELSAIDSESAKNALAWLTNKENSDITQDVENALEDMKEEEAYEEDPIFKSEVDEIEEELGVDVIKETVTSNDINKVLNEKFGRYKHLKSVRKMFEAVEEKSSKLHTILQDAINSLKGEDNVDKLITKLNQGFAIPEDSLFTFLKNNIKEWMDMPVIKNMMDSMAKIMNNGEALNHVTSIQDVDGRHMIAPVKAAVVELQEGKTKMFSLHGKMYEMVDGKIRKPSVVTFNENAGKLRFKKFIRLTESLRNSIATESGVRLFAKNGIIDINESKDDKKILKTDLFVDDSGDIITSDENAVEQIASAGDEILYDNDNGFWYVEKDDVKYNVSTIMDNISECIDDKKIVAIMDDSEEEDPVIVANDLRVTGDGNVGDDVMVISENFDMIDQLQGVEIIDGDGDYFIDIIPVGQTIETTYAIFVYPEEGIDEVMSLSNDQDKIAEYGTFAGVDIQAVAESMLNEDADDNTDEPADESEPEENVEEKIEEIKSEIEEIEDGLSEMSMIPKEYITDSMMNAKKILENKFKSLMEELADVDDSVDTKLKYASMEAYDIINSDDADGLFELVVNDITLSFDVYKDDEGVVVMDIVLNGVPDEIVEEMFDNTSYIKNGDSKITIYTGVIGDDMSQDDIKSELKDLFEIINTFDFDNVSEGVVDSIKKKAGDIKKKVKDVHKGVEDALGSFGF